MFRDESLGSLPSQEIKFNAEIPIFKEHIQGGINNIKK